MDNFFFANNASSVIYQQWRNPAAINTNRDIYYFLSTFRVENISKFDVGFLSFYIPFIYHRLILHNETQRISLFVKSHSLLKRILYNRINFSSSVCFTFWNEELEADKKKKLQGAFR